MEVDTEEVDAPLGVKRMRLRRGIGDGSQRCLARVSLNNADTIADIHQHTGLTNLFNSMNQTKLYALSTVSTLYIH